MDEPLEGLVLRMRPLTESSLIVHWLTDTAGRIATVARGARRPKSPFRGKLDLFHEATFTYRRSLRSDLHALTELVARQPYPALRTDWRRLTQASYGVSLVEALTETDTPLPEVWSLFREFLARVNGDTVSPQTVLALELRLLDALGLLPDPDCAGLPEAAARHARALLSDTWSESVPQDASRRVTGPVTSLLQRLLWDQAGRIPRGRADALGVGEALRRAAPRPDAAREPGPTDPSASAS